ncbi:hypothetical protein ACHAXT_001916 [Thalassiosira profunda]
MHRSRRCTVVAALLLLAAQSISAADQVADHLCEVGPDGETTCETVYFEPDIYDPSLDEEDDQRWRDGLAITECIDFDEDQCKEFAAKGQCDENPGFMEYECSVSCGTCEKFDAAYEALREGSGDGPCTDKYPECKGWAGMGECSFNPGFMQVECERSCMLCYEDTNQFGNTPENNRINYKCRNTHAECSFWAVDECDEDDPNAEWMVTNCGPACRTCHLLDTQLRCPIEAGNELAMRPGELHALFERIVDDADGTGEYLKYKPKALSRPKLKADGSASGGEEDGPWIAVLEGFITDEEADALIAAGHKKGYERSSDVGIENPDGSHEDEVSDGRTSHNAWCTEELCNEDAVIGPVVQRIADLTETHVNNSEYLQLLRYENGQKYEQHHDYIEYQQGLPCAKEGKRLAVLLKQHESSAMTTTRLLRQVCVLLLTFAALAAIVEGGSRRQQRQTREEEDKERYQKPFGLVLTAVFLSVAPLIARLIHCLLTDPAIPLLFHELKIRGKKMIVKRFGSLATAKEE